jgi:SAM-dependent methyltransferase
MAHDVLVSESPPSDPGHTDLDQRLHRWLEALEARHLAELRFPEVTRALRALSSAYVERRHAGGPHGALDSAGKRAAFGLFYAPLHLMAARHVIDQVGAGQPPPARVLDLGCGTGTVGAAWALAARPEPLLFGIDRHAWAVSEARWTWDALGLHGRAVVGDITRRFEVRPGDAIVAGWVMNELPDQARQGLETRLLHAAREGAAVLVLEPISRRATPWWRATAAAFLHHGFHEREWRFPADRPAIVAKLDQAAGLDHRVMTLRSLFRPAQARS